MRAGTIRWFSSWWSRRGIHWCYGNCIFNKRKKYAEEKNYFLELEFLFVVHLIYFRDFLNKYCSILKGKKEAPP